MNGFKDNISKALKRVFVKGNSEDMELALASISIGASAGALFLGATPDLKNIFILSILISSVSFLSAFPFNVLTLRHYSNYAASIISLFISYFIYKSGGDITGIGGYSFLSVWNYYCAFKTKLEQEKND